MNHNSKYTAVYYVKGMHCPSCEINIEHKLRELKHIQSAKVSLKTGKLTLQYQGKKPSAAKLNELFQKDGYSFSEQAFEKKDDEEKNLNPLLIALVISGVFFIVNRLGFNNIVNPNAASTFSFLAFGIIAGLSTCAALIGSLILSLNQTWQATDTNNHSIFKMHGFFHAGRIFGFTIFGAILGWFGSQLRLSLQLSSVFVIVVSLWLVIQAFKMIGFRLFKDISFGLPKAWIHRIFPDKNKSNRWYPLIVGMATVFLPCGFTVSAESFALLSQSPIRGAIIMFLFVLGTAIPLAMISLGSDRLWQIPKLKQILPKTAGWLILFMAVFNINSQLNVLGQPSLNDFIVQPAPAVSTENDPSLAPITDGKQLLLMKASNRGYEPNYFKIRPDQPVRWEITDTGTSGCTNAVIAKDLFTGEIKLTPGNTSVREFNAPKTPGRYKFSCWMGMVTGTIEVIDPSGKTSKNNALLSPPSSEDSPNSSGCGCGK